MLGAGVFCNVFLLAFSLSCFFFFQAEDGIRDLVRSRGLGDVYKRQTRDRIQEAITTQGAVQSGEALATASSVEGAAPLLSLIHI